MRKGRPRQAQSCPCAQSTKQKPRDLACGAVVTCRGSLVDEPLQIAQRAGSLEAAMPASFRRLSHRPLGRT